MQSRAQADNQLRIHIGTFPLVSLELLTGHPLVLVLKYTPWPCVFASRGVSTRPSVSAKQTVDKRFFFFLGADLVPVD